jgi:uncharacterized DUF497 family protein
LSAPVNGQLTGDREQHADIAYELRSASLNSQERDLLARSQRLDWDETKRLSNIERHGIDFEEAVGVLYGPALLSRSDRNNEERWLAIGESDERVIAVVFTWRGDTLRIISARCARKYEKRAYSDATLGRTAKG